MSIGDPVTSAPSFLFTALDWSGDLTAVEVLPLEEGEPLFLELVVLGGVFTDSSKVAHTMNKQYSASCCFFIYSN